MATTKTPTNQSANTKLTTGVVRLSYAHVWEPSAIQEGQEKKYSCSIIISKDDKATLAKIEAATTAATQLGISGKFGGKKPAKLKLPLRDGDEERPEDEAYANCFFLNASSKTKPGIVDKNVNPILDQEEVYSGCYARVSLNFYPFDTNGNKGVAVGLGNIQKVKDGEALGGRSNPEEDFAEVIEDDDML